MDKHFIQNILICGICKQGSDASHYKCIALNGAKNLKKKEIKKSPLICVYFKLLLLYPNFLSNPLHGEQTCHQVHRLPPYGRSYGSGTSYILWLSHRQT